jgi:hypothetical protein
MPPSPQKADQKIDNLIGEMPILLLLVPHAIFEEQHIKSRLYGWDSTYHVQSSQAFHVVQPKGGLQLQVTTLSIW